MCLQCKSNLFPFFFFCRMWPLRCVWNLGNGKWNMFANQAVRLAEGRGRRASLIASQTQWEELQKVNIMRLNKASNLISEDLLIGSVQTYREDFIDGFSPSIKWGITARGGLCTFSSEPAGHQNELQSIWGTNRRINTQSDFSPTNLIRQKLFIYIEVNGSFVRLAHENKKMTSKNDDTDDLIMAAGSISLFWSLSHARIR